MPLFEPGYTGGEATAFLGPLTGVDADQVAAWAIVVISNDEEGPAFRIGSSEEDKRQIVWMLATAIAELSGEPEDEP